MQMRRSAVSVPEFIISDFPGLQHGFRFFVKNAPATTTKIEHRVRDFCKSLEVLDFFRLLFSFFSKKRLQKSENYGIIKSEVRQMEGEKGFIARMKQGKLDKKFEISIHPEGGGDGFPIRFPLHWHEYYEVEIFLTGHATEYVNDKIIEKRKGSFSILSPSACHAVELDGDALLINIRMRDRFFNGSEEIRKKIELPGRNHVRRAFAQGFRKDHFHLPDDPRGF